MTHGAEGGDEKIDVLGAPTRLRKREHRQDQQRRADIKNQVAPTVQDPKVRPRPWDRNCRNGLRRRKSRNVLHVEERANYSPGRTENQRSASQSPQKMSRRVALVRQPNLLKI